jgi:apolipoprotein D and lipocalin family protein
MIRPVRHSLAAALALALLAGAPALAQTTGNDVPNPQTPNFGIERYMGQWYEIARLDHPFQKGLVRVTSTRTRQPDGTIRMVNRGIDKASGQPRESTATARLLESAGRPTLEVDYGAAGGKHTYDVLDMAPDGSYSVVGSTDRSALWILARTPKLEPFVVDQMKARALSAGFSLDNLMMTEQGS